MTRKVGNGLDLQGQRITTVATPTASTDAANKQYVDTVAGSSPIRSGCQAAMTSNVTIANPGTAVFDTVTLVANDRLLLTGQTTASQNGIWVFNGSGVALTRPSDWATGSTQTEGTQTVVERGATTTNHGGWYVTNGTTPDTALTVDTSAETWSHTGQALAAGTGISSSSLSSSTIAVDTTVVVRKYAASFGDGTSTSFVINHGLGTRDVTVCVYTNAAPYDEWDADVQHTDANDVTITFATAPAASGMRVVVHG